MMQNVEKGLTNAVASSFRKYKEKGARSTKKLKPLHKFVADLMSSIWGEEFRVSFMGEGSKEMNIKGKYYPKDVDVTATYDGEPIFCVGIKFVTSNDKQNAKNYFESMMGETANIQATTDSCTSDYFAPSNALQRNHHFHKNATTMLRVSSCQIALPF